MRGRAVSYRAIWLKGADIVAEHHFDDLLVAQDFVLEHMADYRKAHGADGVKVSNGRAIFFQWHHSEND